MPKRLKYALATIASGLMFVSFLALPYEFRYYGLMAGSGILVLLFWVMLGMAFNGEMLVRVMLVVLPVSFFLGYGLFAMLLPLSWLGSIVAAIVFGVIIYMIFLVENVFNVAIDYKTVPLYRAAYTVAFILELLTAFFLFDSILSYRSSFWVNFVATGLVAGGLMMFHNWSVVIGEPEDKSGGWGGNLNMVVPAILIAQLAGIFSFWPVGIFRGSIYLVLAWYVLGSLIQVHLRRRLFRPTWISLVWLSAAMVVAIILTTSWK